MLAALIKAKG